MSARGSVLVPAALVAALLVPVVPARALAAGKGSFAIGVKGGAELVFSRMHDTISAMVGLKLVGG